MAAMATHANPVAALDDVQQEGWIELLHEIGRLSIRVQQASENVANALDVCQSRLEAVRARVYGHATPSPPPLQDPSSVSMAELFDSSRRPTSVQLLCDGCPFRPNVAALDEDAPLKFSNPSLFMEQFLVVERDRMAQDAAASMERKQRRAAAREKQKAQRATRVPKSDGARKTHTWRRHKTADLGFDPNAAAPGGKPPAPASLPMSAGLTLAPAPVLPPTSVVPPTVSPAPAPAAPRASAAAVTAPAVAVPAPVVHRLPPALPTNVPTQTPAESIAPAPAAGTAAPLSRPVPEPEKRPTRALPKPPSGEVTAIVSPAEADPVPTPAPAPQVTAPETALPAPAPAVAVAPSGDYKFEPPSTSAVPASQSSPALPPSVTHSGTRPRAAFLGDIQGFALKALKKVAEESAEAPAPAPAKGPGGFLLGDIANFSKAKLKKVSAAPKPAPKPAAATGLQGLLAARDLRSMVGYSDSDDSDSSSGSF